MKHIITKELLLSKGFEVHDKHSNMLIRNLMIFEFGSNIPILRIKLSNTESDFIAGIEHWEDVVGFWTKYIPTSWKGLFDNVSGGFYKGFYGNLSLLKTFVIDKYEEPILKVDRELLIDPKFIKDNMFNIIYDKEFTIYSRNIKKKDITLTISSDYYVCIEALESDDSIILGKYKFQYQILDLIKSLEYVS